MKVFAESDRTDFAIHRIVNAVKKYAPGYVEFVTSEDEADLVMLYVYGFRRHTKYHIDHLREKGKRHAIIQLCVRSTPNPNTASWIPLWESAEVVWSYYDLPKLCKEDKNKAKFNFYYAPLGVDSEVFKETPHRRKFIIAGTGTGTRFSSECKNEVISAAKDIGRNVFQLGYGPRYENVAHSNGMDDELLARYYSQCEFVSGLHRIEGFELPVIEGLLCGARPICFDASHFRHWFDGLAEFIPEAKNISESLQKVFIKGAKPVSDKEREYVKTNFNWEIIIKGFWKRLGIKLNEFVDKIYCINLDRRPDRWKRCQKIFARHNLDVERFSAIDGMTLTRYHRLKTGELGINRSNLAIIKQAKKNHYKSICIFEDDVELVDDFNRKFSEYIQEVPDDWVFIYLGGANKRPAIPISEHIYRLKRMSCAYALIIHHKIYDVIIKELTAEERWVDVNYSLLQRIYPAYVTIPYLAWVRDGYSDIENHIVMNNHSREYREYKEWM